MRNLPNSVRLPKYDRLRLCNKNNILRWCFRRTLVFYLFLTNSLLFLSETETKAAEQNRKKEDFGYDELNASQLRSSAAHRALQEEEKGKRDEQGGDIQSDFSINAKLPKRLRHLNRNKHHLSSDDEYGDSSSSDSNHCDVCPKDGTFRKRKYHFYILHDVTNVGLYDFFGGSNYGKEVESSIPVVSVPITPVTSMPVVPLPPTTLPPVIGIPIPTLVPATAIPGATLSPTTLVPITVIPGATLPPTTLVPITVIPGATLPPATLVPTTVIPVTTLPPATLVPTTAIPLTTLPPVTLAPITVAPTTLSPATLAPLSAAPIARLASSAAVESSSAAERSPSTESSPGTGRSSLWQWINDFLSRFY